MDSRFKTSNVVALMIAAALIATGFALMFVHQQTESAEKQKPVAMWVSASHNAES